MINLIKTYILANILEFSKLNVLIIDDNPFIHNTLKRGFIDLGIYNIQCAQNYAYALRLCEEIHFHIVICAFARYAKNSIQDNPELQLNVIRAGLSLAKVMIFDELRQREESVILLNPIRNQVMGDSFASQVINEYVEQESEDRVEIHFTPKKLNIMAVEFYKKIRCALL